MRFTNLNYSRSSINLTILRSGANFTSKPYKPVSPGFNGLLRNISYNVSISDIEISHIEAVTGIKRLKQILPKRDFHGDPCPFLKSWNCSIYKARPFVCRRYVTLCKTPFWYHHERSNAFDVTLLSFSEVDKTMALIIKESGQVEANDIRQVFGCI